MPAVPVNPVTGMVLACALLAVAPAARAEKADRGKPMVVESDGKQAASVDMTHRTSTVTGNVLITQGTLQLKADRVEIHEDVPGRYIANARGTADKLAFFRQKRDVPDEFIEAEALRIDYDGGADRVRFSGNAKLRVMRAGVATDEASAPSFVYDQTTDTLTFEGAAAPAGSAAAGGRVKLVFVPRNVESAASAPTKAASAPAVPGASR